MRGVGFVLRRINDLRVLALGYVPERISKMQWDGLFQSGAYKRLESAPERARYSLITGHCDVLGARRILDVGCGQGVLAARLARAQYDRYVGVDISETAIEQARRAVPDSRNLFVAADAQSFDPGEEFDLIVFNECLYYIEDPVAMVRHYLRFLRPGGHISVSMYHTPRSRSVWKLLDPHVKTIEAADLACRPVATWTVKLLQPSGEA